MLHKFFDSIRRGGSSGFSSYFMGIQCRTNSSGPTADEAKKDYQASVNMSPWGRV